MGVFPLNYTWFLISNVLQKAVLNFNLRLNQRFVVKIRIIVPWRGIICPPHCDCWSNNVGHCCGEMYEYCELMSHIEPEKPEHQMIIDLCVCVQYRKLFHCIQWQYFFTVLVAMNAAEQPVIVNSPRLIDNWQPHLITAAVFGLHYI